MTLSDDGLAIEDRICREFEPGERIRARQAFGRYGTESYHREPQRVLNAILDLSKGNIVELEHLLDRALKDYRDILMWHDNPEESKLDTEEKKQQFRKMCRRFGVKGIDIQ